MNFIKKNKVLFIVLGVAAIVSAFMLFKVFGGWGEMRVLDKKVTEKRKNIDELNSKKPAPLEENLVRIEKDSKILKKKLAKIYPRFGAPYKKALDVFASKLGLTRDEVIEKWKTIYKKGAAENENANLILTKFLRSFDSQKISAAEKSFQDALQKETMEDINENNLYDCLMESMGLLRKMDAISCKQYIKDMQTKIVEFLEKKDKNAEGSVIMKDDKVKKLSFEKYDEAMPSPEEIPYIFMHWRMIEDIAKRIKSAKVEYFDEIKRENLLKGDEDKKYRIFTYKLTVRGDMDAVRLFLNKLYDAYKEYKIYRIKSITFNSNDEAGKILSRAAVDEGTRRLSRKRRGRGRRRRNMEIEPEEPKAKLYEPVLGVDDTVMAVIEFDYIVYMGNEIKGGR